MPPGDGTIVMEDVRIVFRNFAGKEGQYNREGDRNFAVLLDDPLAETLLKDGWNVKRLKAREEGDVEQAYLSVSVGFKILPPRIVMITSRGRTTLSEEEVELLDWADIRTVDLIIRPYEWVVNGKNGIKAYLKSLFITIQEDALDLKYADIEDVPSRSGRTDDAK
jgi:hypothetical protein